jgi:hypothetical protein
MKKILFFITSLALSIFLVLTPACTKEIPVAEETKKQEKPSEESPPEAVEKEEEETPPPTEAEEAKPIE